MNGLKRVFAQYLKNHINFYAWEFVYVYLQAFWKFADGISFCSHLQRQVFSALSQIAKHSVDLAEMVVEAEIFPAVLTCLKDQDEYVKKNVATLIREIAKHTPEVRCNVMQCN